MLFELGFVSTIVKGSRESTIQRSFVYNDGILDIVSRVAHYCNASILPCWQFIIVNQLNMCSLDHGLLRVAKQIIDSIVSDKFVKANDSLGLLTHRALEQIPRGLIVMRIRDDSCNYADNRKRIDFKMSMIWGDFTGSQGYKSVVFFIYIQELDNPF